MSKGLRWLCGLMAWMAAMLCVAPAAAKGSVKVASTTVKESDGTWHLNLTIDYGAMPHLAHVPMVLSFTQTALFERYVDDSTGDKPATRVIPINNGVPIDLPMDVGFADMSGKMFKVTKFKFKLTRDAGFEAGEYTMKVRESAGGAIGTPVRLKLEGDNKVVNRKSMDFAAPAPKPKPSNEAATAQPEPAGPTAAEDAGPDLSDIPDISDAEADRLSEADGPPSEKPKQGGCGCEVVGAGDGSPALPLSVLAFAAMLLGLVLMRRR